jgi:hypothetical protein
MLQDIRFAVRTLVKNPGFTVAAVLCLALGIGVNATIFSCVRGLLLRPFPYRNPDELVAIGETNVKRGWRMNPVSYPNFRSWQGENRTLENVGIYTGNSYNLASGDGAEWVQGGTVSWTMFRTLGIAPAIGRDFTEDEDRVGSPKVIMLSDRIWRDRFSARRDVVGQSIMVNGARHTVLGVMPHGLNSPPPPAHGPRCSRSAQQSRMSWP